MYTMPKKGSKKDPKFERFIVLADADHDKVEALLGNALKSNKVVFADKEPIKRIVSTTSDD